MGDVKRILVATDFSSPSRAALARAIDLAVRDHADLDLVHVWQRHSYAAGAVFDRVDARGPATSQGQLEFAQTPSGRELEDWMRQARQRGVSVQGRLESGEPAQAIVALARREGHDLIVMGTRGRSGLARVLRGSVAESVMRRAPCPVETVRAVPA